MHDFPVEKISDGGKPDMRMRPHVETGASAEFGRTEMVEKDEGPDHARARRRQRAPHREAVAEIDGARHDDVRDRLASVDVAGGGIFAGKETHAGFLCMLEKLPSLPVIIHEYLKFLPFANHKAAAAPFCRLGMFAPEPA